MFWDPQDVEAAAAAGVAADRKISILFFLFTDWFFRGSGGS